jgi:hypothetical protein
LCRFIRPCREFVFILRAFVPAQVISSRVGQSPALLTQVLNTLVITPVIDTEKTKEKHSW